ncbi:hypothetical protein, partial [Desulfitobacterium sp.]|uniref:hypothetical protein n=1 Tax=Desulfitobacterium sp. TaxID=49981 RepID=UPI002BEA91FB
MSSRNKYSYTLIFNAGNTEANIFEEPGAIVPHAGIWCAVKGTSEMRVGPSTRTESGRLVKQPRAAVIKSYGSKRPGKRLQ